ncbi:DUF2218 domain-containing protein [Pseudomonas aeruginosa]|nr:DUF2218 domain-containing protein [Pseudomonas aeruginosa]
MFRSTSHVRTESAARYVNRLCKHWGHKFEVELTPERGFIDFGDSNCELLAHPDHVLMILNSPDEDSLAHAERGRRSPATHGQQRKPGDCLAARRKLNAPPPGRPSRPGAGRHARPWKVQFIPRKSHSARSAPSHHPLQALSRR